MLRETLTTETDASLGRRNDADWFKRDENKDDCVATTSHDFATVVSQSHIDRDLKNNQPLGIYEFMEDVERALNMQTVNHEETPRTRKVPMSESEKVDLKGRLQRGGKQGRKLFEHTGGKSKCRKESQIVTCIQLPQPKLVKEKRTRKLTRDWGQRRGILSRKRLNFEEFEKEVAKGEYKCNNQDVEVVHLECHDDEVFKEETDESKTGNRIKFNQSGNDDPEILTEEVTITTNKVIALRGSTPKRESQQQCSCTINTANHAMLCHTMTYNATPYKLCNAIRCHTIQHHDHDAMQHHTTPFHAMQ